MKPGGSGVTVVGDDAQSIYSFRAAEVRNILDFPKSFAERRLSPRSIGITARLMPFSNASNAVIGEATERFTKDLWNGATIEGNDRSSSQSVTRQSRRPMSLERVLNEREAGTLLKHQAVLFRASHHSGALEVELTRRNIPFVKFGGLKFLDAAHVKDVLSVLRFAQNPRDSIAGFRTMQLSTRHWTRGRHRRHSNV